MSQIRLFLNVYLRPQRAFGPIIDEARLAFAVAVALLAVLVVQGPRFAQYRSIVAQAMAYSKAHPAPVPAPPAHATAKSTTPADTSGDGDADDGEASASNALASFGPMPVRYAIDEFTGYAPFHYLPPLISTALCFVPAAILILTLWDSLGRFSNILFRDYLALLVCGLMAWAAAYLPLGLATAAMMALHLPWYAQPALWWAASLYFVALCACAVRTLMGTSALHAAGACAGAWVAGVGGIWLHSMTGNFSWYLASPCVLYYLWANLQSSFHSVGYGLRSRQRMKRMLETATINPRDSDAHYQLGLIYQQRRQYELAIERFRQAAEIDAAEPDAWYQLGRIAHLQGRYADALNDCQTAARLDDKHAASEVWREIGAVQFRTGRLEAARHALEKFTERRPYDPEGQCWYGRVLAALGEPEGARRAFQEAIEAARTMPAPRKYQVRCWAAEANKELRALRGGAAVKRPPRPELVRDSDAGGSRKSA